MADNSVRETLSKLDTLTRHFWFTAHRATFAAGPGRPRHKVQQVWATFSPHLSAHFFSFSSHPLVDLHLAY